MTTEFRRQMQLRGTPTDWSSNDIVLLQGEIGLEMITGGWRMKAGDGTAAWSALPYIGEKDQTARDANTLQDTEISNLDARVTAIEGTSTDLTDLQAQVDLNTTNIAGKQASLGSASSPGNITFWDGAAWVATGMTLPHGGLYYWSTAAEDYVALAPGATNQVLTWDTAGVPKWKPIPPTGGGVEEAPFDTVLYARRDGVWDPVPEILPEAPVDGEFYARKDGDWESIPGGLSDAPSDGDLYGRKDGAWEAVPDPGIADAPSDGKTYGRKDGAWIELVAVYDLYFDFGPSTIAASAERALVLARAITIPADLTGSRVSLAAGDSSAPVFTLYEGATARGTLTLTSSGGTWAATVGGTPISIAAGQLVRLVAPGAVASAFLGLRASVAATRN